MQALLPYAPIIHWSLVVVWLLVCSGLDLKYRLVNNGLTLGIAGLALVYLLLDQQSWLFATMNNALTGLFITLLLTFPGYATGKLGGADVKLLIALALLSEADLILGTFIGAGVCAAIGLTLGRRFSESLPDALTRHWRCIDSTKAHKLPFVPYISAGFLLSAALLH